MSDIVNLFILGCFAGMISVFWTRIIGPHMIFAKVGKLINKVSNRSLLMFKRERWWVQVLTCVFCLPPYLCVIFSAFYIIEYSPHWTYAFIGVLASLGGANYLVELIYALRNE